MAKATPAGFLGEEGGGGLNYIRSLLLVWYGYIPHHTGVQQGFRDKIEIQIPLSVNLKVCSDLNRICVLTGQLNSVV